jgi:hypothetical protein
VNPGPVGAEGTYTAVLKIKEVVQEVSCITIFISILRLRLLP